MIDDVGKVSNLPPKPEKRRWEKKTPEEMDLAGDVAEQKFDEILPSLDQTTLKKIATWWEDNYLDAGHKRLGRILKSKAG